MSGWRLLIHDGFAFKMMFNIQGSQGKSCTISTVPMILLWPEILPHLDLTQTPGLFIICSLAEADGTSSEM